MSSTEYDYAIIGAGAAGLHLALAMLDDPWFANKKVLILDKDQKSVNDKTWCFWEKGNGKWDSIISQNWSSGKFLSHEQDLELKLDPYRYKMLNAINLYKYAKSKIEQSDNFHWISEEVKEVLVNEHPQIITEGNTYTASQIFDSRIDPDFYRTGDKYLRLLQHFKGWFIKTEKPVFDPSRFIMMDYRIKWQDSTSFTYILPTSSTEALVEFTFFSPELVEDEIYDQNLKKYIKNVLGTDQYTIQDTEQGIIPMSNYPFFKANKNNITKIGTAGGWVKGSSGYSFKNAEKMASKIVGNLKKGNPVDKGLYNKKYHIYDTLFLDVLSKRNELGEELFVTMYTKNKIQRVFEFLDEETNILQDIAIMNTFDKGIFMKAIRNQYF
jgi:lycopene beta-cyclase